MVPEAATRLRSRQDVIAPLLQATGIDRVAGVDVLFGGAHVLPAFLALSRCSDDSTGSRCALGTILAVVLLDVIVDLIVQLFMLAAPDLRCHAPGDSRGGRAFYTTACRHRVLCRVLGVGLGLASAGVLLDGLGTLVVERDNRDRQGA
ncbi:hypothetical protein D3C73_1325150 [compost metagenome]